MAMTNDITPPFSSFSLTLHRTGGVADVDQTIELRWEKGEGTVESRWRTGHESTPVDTGRVQALWERLESLGFWDQEKRTRGLLGRLFSGTVNDAMTTTISATAVVDSHQRRAHLSFTSPSPEADEHALQVLQAIQSFLTGNGQSRNP